MCGSPCYKSTICKPQRWGHITNQHWHFASYFTLKSFMVNLAAPSWEEGRQIIFFLNEGLVKFTGRTLGEKREWPWQGNDHFAVAARLSVDTPVTSWHQQDTCISLSAAQRHTGLQMQHSEVTCPYLTGLFVRRGEGKKSSKTFTVHPVREPSRVTSLKGVHTLAKCVAGEPCSRSFDVCKS